MKTISCLVFILGISIYGSTAFANPTPQIDCYKAVMADPEVLTVTKAKQVNWSEARATELCSGASESNSRIACFKATMTDLNVMTNLKRTNLVGAEYHAVSLCSR